MKPNRRNSLIRPHFFTALFLGMSLAGVQGADITFSTPATITSDTDVSTSGTLVAASSLNAGGGSINGVTFASGPGSTFTLTPAGTAYTGFGGGSSAPFNGLSAAYQTLLSHGRYRGGAGGLTVTLNGLTIGNQYAVQVWSNDSRVQSTAAYNSIVGVNTVQAKINSTGALGGIGQTTIGTFVADGPTQTFTVTGASYTSNDTYLNALQLRDLGVGIVNTAGYWNGLNGSAWDAATTVNWSTNISTNPLTSDTFSAAMALSNNVAYFRDTYFNNGAVVNVTQNNVVIAAGGVSATTVNVTSSSVNYTFSSADAAGLSGVTALNKTGTSTLTLASANTFTGNTLITSGAVKLGHTNSLANSTVTPSVANGLTFGPGVGSFLIGGLSGGGNLTLADTASAAITLQVGGNGADTTYSGVMSGAGALTKVGTGTLTLTGRSVHTGAVVVNAGTLRGELSSADGTLSRISSLTINNGGTVLSGSNGLFGYNANVVPITVNAGGTLSVDGGTGGGPNIYGALTLAGGTVADGGSLHPTYGSYNFGGGLIHATGPTPSTLSAKDFQLRSATNVHVDSGATLNVTGYFTSLAHSGSQTLTKSGPGTLVLGGTTANAHGATTVTGGTLGVTGTLGSGIVTVATTATLTGSGTINGPTTIQSGGTLSLAGAGIGPLQMNSTLNLGGTTAMEITKTGGTVAADRVSGLSGVTYGGTLTVTNLTGDGTPLATGDTFTLFSSSAYSGGFSTYNLPALPAGMSWDKSNLTQNGTITVISSVATPVFNPPSGGYAGAQSVTITADAGSTIYYTTDGSSPTLSSPHGPSPINGVVIPTDASTTLKAFATLSGQADSAVSSASYVTITTPTWTQPAGGSWASGTPAHWASGVVAGGSGVTADFSTLTLTAPTVVTLDGTRTIGNLRFGEIGSTHGWTLAAGSGSSLILDGPTPTITVDTSTSTSLSVVLNGANGMTKAGGGNLTLTAIENYSGGTLVNSGTLTLSAGTAAYNSSTLQGALTVNPGATCSLTAATAFGWGGGLTDVHLPGGTLTGISPIALGVSYHLTGGTISTTDTLRLGLLTGGGNVFIESAASPVTSTITAPGITLSQIFGQTAFSFTVAQGTTASGVDLRIDSAIGESAGGSLLTKAGSGNLLLTGVNTYTGATTVSAGTLTVNGSLSTSSAVTVSTGSTLAGTGTVAGSVTLGTSAFIAPGGAMTGTLTTGAATLTGSYTCQIDGANADTLAVTGDLNVTGATLAVSTLAGGAGQPLYIIATYTGSLTGTFNTAGLPPGYQVNYNATDKRIELIQHDTAFDLWANSFPSLIDKSADGDPDNDGMKNLLEYILGGNPTVSDSSIAPTQTLDTNNLIFKYKRNDASETDTPQIVQWSENLTTWTDISIPAGNAGVVTVNEDDNNPDNVTVTIPRTTGKMFVRLKAVR